LPVEPEVFGWFRGAAVGWLNTLAAVVEEEGERRTPGESKRRWRLALGLLKGSGPGRGVLEIYTCGARSRGMLSGL